MVLLMSKGLSQSVVKQRSLLGEFFQCQRQLTYGTIILYLRDPVQLSIIDDGSCNPLTPKTFIEGNSQLLYGPCKGETRVTTTGHSVVFLVYIHWLFEKVNVYFKIFEIKYTNFFQYTLTFWEKMIKIITNPGSSINIVRNNVKFSKNNKNR